MDFGYVVSSQALNQDLDDGALERVVAGPESDGCRSCSSEARLHRRIRFALLFVFYVFVLATLVLHLFFWSQIPVFGRSLVRFPILEVEKKLWRSDGG